MASNNRQSESVLSWLSTSKHTLSSFVRLAKSVRQLSNIRTQQDNMSPFALRDILGTKYRELKALRMTTKAEAESTFPGVEILNSHLLVFEDTLNSFINDSDKANGSDLERPSFNDLMYCSGVLEGHATILLEYSAIWKTKPQTSNIRYQVSSYPSAQHSSSSIHIPVPLVSLQPSLTQSPHDNSSTMPPTPAGSFFHNVDPSTQNVLYSKPTRKRIAEDGEEAVIVKLESHTRDCIASLWKEQKHTDVTFVVGDKKECVSAHRAILAAHSSYFKSLLYGDMLEAEKDEIVLFDVPNPQLFVSLVEYSYTGQLHILKEDILELLALADRFALTTLKDTLGNSLVSLVTLDNVLTFIAYADMYQVKHLLNRCLCLIDENGSSILELDGFCSLSPSALQLIISRDTFVAPEIDIFKAVVQWKEYNSKQVNDVVNCVRLSEIPAKYLFTAVEPTKLFDQSEITTALRIQIKPEFQSRKPRGKKEIGRNLFELAKFSSSGNVEYSGNARNGPPRIMDGVVEMDASQIGLESKDERISPSLNFGSAVPNMSSYPFPYTSHGPRSATRRSNLPVLASCRTKMIEFGDVHLINTIKILAFPEKQASVSSSSQADYSPLSQWQFSYKIRISRDKESWETLFDFSQVDCYFSQTLHFPTQAVKCIDFQLVSCEKPLRLKFVSCSLEDTTVPFRFLEKGVIGYISGSLEYFEVFELPPNHPTSLGIVALVFVLPTPASMTQLKFKLCCPDDSVSGDIQVFSSCVWEYSSFKSAGVLIGSDLRDELLWNLEEQIVSYILVHITNIKSARPSLPSSSTVYSVKDVLCSN